MPDTSLFVQMKQRVHQLILAATLTALLLLGALVVYLSMQANEASYVNARSAFESSRWNALQLQVQTYRFANYLQRLSKDDLPLQGDSLFQYDLLMSRIDLLRTGQIGDLVKTFGGGRVTRLINIINGEFELIGASLARLEQGDLAVVSNILARLEVTDTRINELVVLVNEGANDHVTEQRNQLNHQLELLQNLCVLLTLTLAALLILLRQQTKQLQTLRSQGKQLEAQLEAQAKQHTNELICLVKQLHPSVAELVGGLSPQSELSAADTRRIRFKAQQLDRNLNAIQALITPFEPQHLKENLTATVEVFDTLFEQLIPQLRFQHNRLILRLDPSLPAQLTTDFVLLQQTISPLLESVMLHDSNQCFALTIQTSDLPVPTNGLFQAPIMVQCHLQTSVKDFFSEAAKAMLIEPLHNSENDGLMTYVCELGVSLTLMKLRLEQLGGGLRLSIKPDQTLDFLLDLPFEKVHLAPTLAVKTAPLSGHIHLVKSEQFDGHSYQNTILVHILSNMGLIVSQSTSLVNQEDATKADLILLANHNPIAAMLTLPELHKDQDEYDIPTEALIPLPAIITFATLRTFLQRFLGEHHGSA
ncbi:hypothetical protein FJM67_06540 [Maribrevibacterium harenarium]|uniref:Uncharacterized protein n=1 Tax=Maribrevibacterium harenarium TaxID=2589817 RepID=A0A501WW08_9GAMM|nr:hypothetical protein [Maribrevibacterium harenarium]TPE53459.1 hypothetical protein FJM67_06540 [Maribrevibacterium harenarium]